MRSAYLPYKTCRRVGKRKRTHHSSAKRQVRSAYLPYKTAHKGGKRKRTHLPATEKTQKIKTKKAQHTLGFYMVISGELNRRR
ncbi:hypothetical protein DC438_13580 [Cronobacter sakazakii]|nr:hypothetical protein DC438_13580 [Cronobacter sakazakii]PPY41280.1 hypothetical protein C3D65_02875 [Cronobacter sakazakii]PPY49266.1 hypothetical protein C3D64_11020 [Cronobacter sakazakii]PQY26897.1 hypothetical protein C5946_13470 [Cronobacter sakazakii]PUY30977.1 hypothetical protein BS421_08745 [Cronobacter sakazakii]